jgi:hypothetical protein
MRMSVFDANSVGGTQSVLFPDESSGVGPFEFFITSSVRTVTTKRYIMQSVLARRKCTDEHRSVFFYFT